MERESAGLYLGPWVKPGATADWPSELFSLITTGTPTRSEWRASPAAVIVGACSMKASPRPIATRGHAIRSRENRSSPSMARVFPPLCANGLPRGGPVAADGSKVGD